MHVQVRAFGGMYLVCVWLLVESALLVCAGAISVECRAVFLSCVVLVMCSGAWWFHVVWASVVFPCACVSAFCMRDGGHVAPPSCILKGAVLWVCVWWGGGSQRSRYRRSVI